MDEARERHLLLVAAGEGPHGLAGVAQAHVELVRPLGGLPPLEGGVEDAPAGAGAEPRGRDVVGHGEGEGEALALAVLAQVAEAVGQPPGRRRVEGALPPSDAHAPGRRAGEAEEGSHHLGAARSP